MRLRTPLRRLAPFGLAFALLGAGLTWNGSVGQASDVTISTQSTPATVAEHDVPVLTAGDREDVSASDERSETSSGQTAPEPTSAPAAPSDDDAPAVGGTVVAALPATAVKPFSMVGVVWDSGVSQDASVEVQWHGREGWSRWTSLDVESAEEGRPGTDPQWVDRADAAAVRVIDPSGESRPRGLSLTTVDPGRAPAAAPVAATVGQPRITMRSQWGAAAQNDCSSPRYGNKTRGAILHHTAGSNTYTKAQSASIVRATQAYHMKGQNWCDIGYNFLVDRYGQIFEGRAGGITRAVRAAHSGNDGVNREAFGVSMMGTFVDVMPPLAQRKAVADLIAWRFAIAKLPARGRYDIGGVRIDRIAGHRDVKSTECPGAQAYKWLNASDGLRHSVAVRLDGKAVVTQPTTLSTPRSLAVTALGRTTAGLSWGKVSGATGYRVEVSRSSKFTDSSFRTYTATSGTVGRLSPKRTYWFRVVATNGKATQTSKASSGVRGTTHRWSTPASLKATSATTTALALDWAGQEGATRYLVQIASNSAMKSPRELKVATSKATVKDLKPGRRYWFRVAIKNSSTGAFDSAWTSSPYPSAVTATDAKAVDVMTLPKNRSFVLDGHGFGHGIGMSQYGAEGGARAGKRASQILAHYYPGTRISTTKHDIRVLITADTTPAVTVKARSGLAFRQGSGSRRALPARTGAGSTIDQWSIKPEGTRSIVQYRAKGAWHTYRSVSAFRGTGEFDAGSGAVSLVLPSGSSVAYRGALRSVAPSSGSSDRNTVNDLDIDDYTRGVIPAEMPPSWQAEALRTQAIAARTYGLRLLSPSRTYDICDTTACQVYGGASRETSTTNAAVKSTSRMVLTKDGKAALTQFSSSSGGWSKAGSESYLKAVKDPWDGWSGNPVHSWSIRVRASTVERAYPSIGTLRSMTVTKRNGLGSMGGRVVSLRITGSKGSRTVSGTDARSALGLRSDWFGF